LSIQKFAFLGNISKYNSTKVGEIRQKLDSVASLGSLDQLEEIIPFHELIRLPRRDALACFGIYSALLAESFGELSRNNSIKVPSSYNVLLAYINRYNQSLDDNFIQEGDFLFVWRKKWFVYRLVDQFRKVLNLAPKSTIRKILKKPLPLTQEEKTVIEFFSTPSLLFREVAYWKSQTSYSNVLKLIYFADRVASNIGKSFKKHAKTSYGTFKRNVSGNEIYNDLKLSIAQLQEFVQSICPINKRKIRAINPPQYKLPYYLEYKQFSKSRINFIKYSGLKEISDKILLPFRKEGLSFSFHNDPWLEFVTLLNNFIKTFLQEYHYKLKQEQKETFFLRLLYETANTFNLSISTSLPSYVSDVSIIKEKTFRRFIYRDLNIKFIRSDAFFAFEDLLKQMIIYVFNGVFTPASTSFYHGIQPLMITRSFFASSYEIYQRLQGDEPHEQIPTPLPTISPAESVSNWQFRGFPDPEVYGEAQQLGAQTYEQYNLIQKLQAPDYVTAEKIKRGNFPDYQTYTQAVSEGFSNYQDWQLKETRKEKLVKLMKRVDSISKDDFMRYLKFTDISIFLDWLLDLPDDSPIRLKGDLIVFQTENISEGLLTQSIDDLMKSYDKAEHREKL
jgi:hypothetical protein